MYFLSLRLQNVCLDHSYYPEGQMTIEEIYSTQKTPPVHYSQLLPQHSNEMELKYCLHMKPTETYATAILKGTVFFYSSK